MTELLPGSPLKAKEDPPANQRRLRPPPGNLGLGAPALESQAGCRLAECGEQGLSDASQSVETDEFCDCLVTFRDPRRKSLQCLRKLRPLLQVAILLSGLLFFGGRVCMRPTCDQYGAP